MLVQKESAVLCVVFVLTVVMQVTTLSGPNVCMVQQKYNITKRVKYRAPMSVRTYEWCFSMPPRCSKWKTEMRDLTRLETQERVAEVAVCCPGYKMKDVSCVPICPNGKTGTKCTEECPPNKWGPNCVNNCTKCLKGICSPITGECDCLDGWQGESCNIRMTTLPPARLEEILTTTKSTLQTIPISANTVPSSTKTSELDITTEILTTSPYSKPIFTEYSTTVKSTEETTTVIAITDIAKDSEITSVTPSRDYSNVSLVTTIKPTVATTSKTLVTFIYNRTETPVEGTSANLTSEHVTSTSKIPLTTLNTSNTFTTKTPVPSVSSSTLKPLLHTENLHSTTEAVRKLNLTTKLITNTPKFKPKEIWIKPSQKGLSTEYKIKISHDHSQIRSGGKNDSIAEVTTPRTIIVSIIPTSVSHASFKKIALTTKSYVIKSLNTSKEKQSTDPSVTKSMLASTSTQAPFTIKILTTKQRNFSTLAPNSKSSVKATSSKHTLNKPSLKSSTSAVTTTSTVKTAIFNTSTLINSSKFTNSMMDASATTRKTFNISNVITLRTSTNKTPETKTMINMSEERKFLKDEVLRTRKPVLETTTRKSLTTNFITTLIPVKKRPSEANKRNITKPVSILTTETPIEDETFHILTEPEHITAVMSDKERENNSLDLISIISVAGGVMMALITVAVIIVMFERCRRPSYDDVRKMNDIRMQDMMDNDDVPPPYVRSIFHTPLPDPPGSEKCHYQPISTLDRNLKQFMRPVVVQNISLYIMLENFRGILECHYDHLPRRNHDIGISARSSLAPSINSEEQQSHKTKADYTIEALKCEAKLDVIDLNSEPLYAEIPCWRPPSEHAIEVMNLNGEAVTEL